MVIITIKIFIMGVNINKKGNAERLKSERNIKDYRKRVRVIGIVIRFRIFV